MIKRRGSLLSSGGVVASYFSQAAFALAQILIVSRVLPRSEYTSFSIALSGSQLLAVIAFEWVRVASSRFQPNATSATLKVLKSTAVLIFVAELAIMFAASMSYPFRLGGSRDAAYLLCLAAGAQGITDIVLTTLRSTGSSRTFSVLQTLRGLASTTGAASGAVFFYSWHAAMVGYIAGILLPFLLVFLAPKLSTSRDNIDGLYTPGSNYGGWIWKYLHYGFPAATASMIFLGIPVGLRLVLDGKYGAGGSAGPILAVDYLQRPFNVAIGALLGLLFPDVVRAFEGGDRLVFRTKFFRMMAASEIVILVLALLGYLFLPLVATILVRSDLHGSFISASLYLLPFFASQALVQNNGLLCSAVDRRTHLQVCVAAADLAIIFIVLHEMAIYLPFMQPMTGILLASAVTALMCILYVWRASLDVVQRCGSPNFEEEHLAHRPRRVIRRHLGKF